MVSPPLHNARRFDMIAAVNELSDEVINGGSRVTIVILLALICALATYALSAIIGLRYRTPGAVVVFTLVRTSSV